MHDLLPYISAQLQNTLNGIGFFMPELTLGLLFLLVIITDLIFGRNSERLCRIVACAGILVVIFRDLQQVAMVQDKVSFLFGGMLLLNRATLIFKFAIDLLSFILLLYFGWDNKLRSHSKRLPDLYTITIGSILGLHLMVMAINLLSVYVAIEMVSIASYLMVAYRSENAFSSEAGLKYVLFGAASSAIMLYGISLMYGLSGTLSLFSDTMMQGLLHANSLIVVIAVALVMVGIGFKLSFVPIHFWVPDVYEGAATPVMAYLSTLPKIAAFGLLTNFLTPFIFFVKFPAIDFRLVLSVIGILTMIAGNFAAIWQSNIKRMLAYSSIGHTGFALMAIVTFTPQGITALAYYLIVYGLANITALALATYFANESGAEDLEAYSSLGLKYPAASVCFIIILISLTGLPITAGFTGKLFVFSAVYGVYQQGHDVWLMLLMVTGALTTVVSLFYYIKIPLYLFIKKAETPVITTSGSRNIIIFAIIMVVLIILLGLFPNSLLQYLKLS